MLENSMMWANDALKERGRSFQLKIRGQDDGVYESHEMLS